MNDNVDAAQLAKAQALMTEKPNVKTAVKNYWMMVLASGLPGLDRAGEDQTVILRCARKLSAKINAITLKPPAEWGVDHPQPEDQTGIARMDEIANYKVVYSLWAAADKARAAGAKLTAMIGRTFLKEVWADHLSGALTADSTPGSTQDTDEEEAAFWSGFEAELFKDDAAEGLVWSTDVDTVLSTRAKQRQSAAVEKAADAEAKIKEVIEEALPTNAGGGGGSSGGGGGGSSGGGGGSGGALSAPASSGTEGPSVPDVLNPDTAALLAEVEAALVEHITTEYTATAAAAAAEVAAGSTTFVKVAAKARVMLSFREPLSNRGLQQRYENTLLWSDYGHPSIKLQEDALKCIISEIGAGAGAGVGAGDPTAGNSTTEEWVYALSQNLVARAGLLLDLGCIADTASSGSGSGSDGGGGKSSSGAP